MKTQFHGSKCVAGQMFQRFTARQLLREYAAKNINFTTEETISNFFVSRLETKMNIEHRVERSLKAIGKFKYEKLSAGEIIAVENWYDGRILKCHFACAYSRILVNGKCFSSALYSADLKRDNSVVKIGNSFAIIEKFFIVNENCNCVMIPNGVCMMNSWSQYSSTIDQPHQMLIIGRQLKVNNHASCQDSFCRNINLVNFMKIIVPESFRDRVIFKPVDITSKCVIIPNQSKELVIVPNNCRFEMD
jgi:hypothetical protein